MNYLLLPLAFLKFWYWEGPREMLGYFLSLNHAFLQLFSLPLYLKTFFKPLKNEYRQGLVRFSRIMGVIVKSNLIVINVVIFAVMVALEAVIFIGFIAFPVLTVLLLFW